MARAISLARAPRTRDQSKCQIRGGARFMRAGEAPPAASVKVGGRKLSSVGRGREGGVPSFRLRKVRLRGMVMVVTCFSSGLSGVT